MIRMPSTPRVSPSRISQTCLARFLCPRRRPRLLFPQFPAACMRLATTCLPWAHKRIASHSWRTQTSSTWLELDGHPALDLMTYEPEDEQPSIFFLQESPRLAILTL